MHEVIAAITTSPCAKLHGSRIGAHSFASPADSASAGCSSFRFRCAVLVFFSRPSGIVSADCLPPPGAARSLTLLSHFELALHFALRLAVTVSAREQRKESFLEISEQDAILRALRTGNRGFDFGKIKIDERV